MGDTPFYGETPEELFDNALAMPVQWLPPPEEQVPPLEQSVGEGNEQACWNRKPNKLEIFSRSSEIFRLFSSLRFFSDKETNV